MATYTTLAAAAPAGVSLASRSRAGSPLRSKLAPKHGARSSFPPFPSPRFIRAHDASAGRAHPFPARHTHRPPRARRAPWIYHNWKSTSLDSESYIYPTGASTVP